MFAVAVPGDDRDAPIEKSMGHRGTHQADAQQPDANLLLTGLGVHSPPAIIPQTRRSSQANWAIAARGKRRRARRAGQEPDIDTGTRRYERVGC